MSASAERAGRVAVAGSIHMDVVVRTTRQPRPGETVAGTDLRFYPGGRGANQAVARAATGTALVIVDDASQNTIVAVAGANNALQPAHVTAVTLAAGDIATTQLEIPIELCVQSPGAGPSMPDRERIDATLESS